MLGLPSTLPVRYPLGSHGFQNILVSDGIWCEVTMVGVKGNTSKGPE